jgi:UDP:flavonoid glycosyltransferase YjiC (YdhE family)
MPYSNDLLEAFLLFIRKDSRPTLFFTMGSIKGEAQEIFAKRLYAICKKHNYKFVIGSGWGKIGQESQEDDIFVLDSIVPHNLILKHCTALIHHGGSGTAHNAVRSGRPQMALPKFVDQYYWAERIRVLGIGPGGINQKKISDTALEEKVLDLMTNETYAKNAGALGEKLRAEDGVKNAVTAINQVFS